MNFDTKLSEHGENLLKMYQLMASDGYNQKDGTRVESAYSEFEMHKFRQICQPHFHFHDVKTVLSMALVVLTGMHQNLIQNRKIPQKIL